MSNGKEYQKSYFYPRILKGDWAQSKLLCKGFDLELATFETLNEAFQFLSMIASFNASASLPTPKYFYTDGFTLTIGSVDDWYWTKNGNKVSFDIPWAPYEPNSNHGLEYCLSVGKASLSQGWGFNDVHCQHENKTFPFICQRMDFDLSIKGN